MSYTRFAVYYLPPEGALAAFGARWLGWDVARGRAAAPFDIAGLSQATEAPRRYGFHATLKPPFRLAPGRDPEALDAALAALAARTAPARCAGLRLARLGSFLALTPAGDAAGIARVAAAMVRDLDAFRAAPAADELARRRAAGLTAAQDAALLRWGYPYVMEAFRFHMTLTGRLAPDALEIWEDVSRAKHPALPAPFLLDAVALVGERDDGRFELIRRHRLGG